MENDQRFLINAKDDFSLNNHAHLFMLYRPLIGMQACVLYEVMLALAADQQSGPMELLCELSGLNVIQFEQARKALESLKLLQTIYKQEESLFLFYVFPCMNGEAFLNDEIYSRILIENLSKEHYKKLVSLFTEDLKEEDGKDISAVLSLETIARKWTDDQEAFFQENRPNQAKEEFIPFDWDLFFEGFERIFPKRLRTKSNLNRIARLANFYGLDELSVKKQVPTAMDADKTRIDFNVLQNRLIAMQPSLSADSRDPYQLPPILFLQRISPSEVRIMKSEKQMLQEFYEQYGFSFEVINTLIEYGLKECDQQLNEKFLQKVANTWKRKNIQNRRQALQAIKKDNKVRKPAKKRDLPDYYTYVPTGKADPEVLRQALLAEEEFNNT